MTAYILVHICMHLNLHVKCCITVVSRQNSCHDMLPEYAGLCTSLFNIGTSRYSRQERAQKPCSILAEAYGRLEKGAVRVKVATIVHLLHCLISCSLTVFHHARLQGTEVLLSQPYAIKFYHFALVIWEGQVSRT